MASPVRVDAAQDLAGAVRLFDALSPIRQPDARTAPGRRLGPRCVATFDLMVGPSTSAQIHQQLYPLAQPRPVVYVPAAQPAYGATVTRGGWYRVPRLARVLERVGVDLGRRR
jgi:hypothetical protein